jgi:hypothetical protein
MIPNKPIVVLLLVLQIVSVVYVWGTSYAGTPSAGRFALFVAIDLLSFSLVAYVYTRERWGEAVIRAWILLGSCGLILLLLYSLFAP